MQAFVRLRTARGQVVELGHGDVIGRLRTAALRLDDPRVSEAHALVSLRGLELKLLALRGRFTIDGASLTEVVLRPGLVIAFAPDVAVGVMGVVLPDRVLAIEGDAFPRQVLPAVASLRVRTGELVPGFVADADALFWNDGEGFRVRREGAADADLLAGDTLVLRGTRFGIVEVALERAAASDTERAGDEPEPLTLVLRYDTVHVRRGDAVDAIDGLSARIISELAVIGAPIEWRALAHELWKSETEDESLRQKWDAALGRLRKRLRELELRPNLVRTDGRGRVELFLAPRDRVEDEM